MDNRAEPPETRPGKLVLASTSPYRKQLLARLRVPFESLDPSVDEDAYKGRGLPPNELVRALAEAKARAIGQVRPRDLIVGGDQCASLDGLILGKPLSFEGAVDQLAMLAGRTHLLITALSLLDPTSGRCDTVVDVHEMTMRPLDRGQIQRYVAIDRPMDCAGSYKLESLGVALFERVAGSDPTAIVGMPLMRLVSMLDAMGYDVFAHAVGT
jgi:septum formation protein